MLIVSECAYMNKLARRDMIIILMIIVVGLMLFECVQLGFSFDTSNILNSQYILVFC